MLFKSLLKLILGFVIILLILVFVVGLNADIALKIASGLIIVVYLSECCMVLDRKAKSSAYKTKYR